MPNRLLRVDTLGALAEAGYSLHACCDTLGCLRTIKLDLEELIRQCGPETPIDAVKGRLRIQGRPNT